MKNYLNEWWVRPSGGREVLIVAFPLVISSLSWTVMTFVDRMFLNWVSGSAMSAAFSASMIWFLFLCFPLGICAYANTFVAQYQGAERPKRIGMAVWQSIWVALLFLPFTPLLQWIAPTLFALGGHASEIQEQEVVYFQTLAIGAVGLLVSQAASSFFSGRGKTTVVMCVDTLFAILNILLDYLWIFGMFGFAEMGIAGAGYATSISLWLKALTYVLLMLRSPHRDQFSTWKGARFHKDLFRRLLYFGGPSGLQMLLDVAGFTVFVMLIGRLGTVEAEATSMAFSISTLAFMPIWGFGIATGILVGQNLGKNEPDLAGRASWTTLTIALSYMATISVLYVCLPDVFLYGFFVGSQQSLADQLDVKNMAITLLWYVAAYNLFDAGLVIFCNAIKGAGDTLFILYVSLIMGLLLAAASWYLVEVWHVGIYGCWMLITGWVWVGGVLFLLRFLQGKWKHMRVIEAAPPTDSSNAS